MWIVRHEDGIPDNAHFCRVSFFLACVLASQGTLRNGDRFLQIFFFSCLHVLVLKQNSHDFSTFEMSIVAASDRTN